MTGQENRASEEAFAGKGLGSRELVITSDMLDSYYEGLELDRSRYAEDPTIVPPMVLTAADGGFAGAGLGNAFGNLWIRQQWEMRLPAVVSQAYKVTSKILDVYEWRERRVVKQEVSVWTSDGEMMARGTHHQSYMAEQTSGMVKLRDPKVKEGVRRFAVPQGEELDPIDRTITLEMCGSFFHGNRNYHTNKEAAEELGFSNVVVGGKMTMSYVGELMDRRFAQGWLEGGSLDVKFTNIVWPDEHVTARGVITGRAEEEGGTRATVAVWAEKDDGTVVIVGTASALE